EALSMADLVAGIDDGRLIQVGPPAEVYAKPASRWLAQFVGGAVVVPGVWRGGKVVGPLGTVGARLADGESARNGDGVDLVLRPEQLAIGDLGSGGKAGIRAMVRNVAYFGHDAVVTLDIPAHAVPIEARVLGDRTWTPDSEVVVTVRSPGLVFARQTD